MEEQPGHVEASHTASEGIHPLSTRHRDLGAGAPGPSQSFLQSQMSWATCTTVRARHQLDG